MKIQIESGQTLELPDGSTPEQIDEVVGHFKSSQPTPPQAKPVDSVTDTALTVGSNLLKGGVDAAMILPNMINQAVAGPQYLYEGIVGEDRKDFKPWQPLYSSEDVVSDSAIDYQPKTTAGKIAEFPSRLAGNIAGPSVVNKAGGKVFPGKPVSSADKKMQSQAKYDAVEKSGASTANGVIDDYALKVAALRPSGRVQQAIGKKDAFDEALEEINAVKGLKNLSIKEVQDLDSRLTALAEGARNGGMGTAQSRLINKAKYLWRDTVEDAAKSGKINGNADDVKLWQGAVKDYSTAGRANDIELIMERAKLSDNPSTVAKNGFKNLYLKIQQGKARGYNAEQTKAIKHAAETGITTGIARVMASKLNPIIALSSTGIDGGVTMGAVSKASNAFATKAQLGRGNNALQSVTGGRQANPINQAWAARNQAAATKAGVGNADGAIVNETPNMSQDEVVMEPMSYEQPQSNFDNAVSFVLDTEGGYVRDDAGKGETNMGINKTANPDLDIKNLSPDQARARYKTKYWDAIDADSLPPSLALVAFDAAVNQGPSRAKEFIKLSKGDPMKLLQLRKQHYDRLVKENPKKFKQYYAGWMSRLNELATKV